MTESAQETLDALVKNAEMFLEHVMKRPGMYAAHIETYEHSIHDKLWLIERIRCGPESNHTMKAYRLVQKEYFGDAMSPLVNWCRFKYKYEVAEGPYEEDSIPPEVMAPYNTMPQETDHPHHAEIIDFYRKWVKLALEAMAEDA